MEADVNPLVATLRERVLTGDGVRGSGGGFLEGVGRGVGVSGGGEGRSLSLSLDRWINVGVDGDGGMPGGWDLVDR